MTIGTRVKLSTPLVMGLKCLELRISLSSHSCSEGPNHNSSAALNAEGRGQTRGVWVKCIFDSLEPWDILCEGLSEFRSTTFEAMFIDKPGLKQDFGLTRLIRSVEHSRKPYCYKSWNRTQTKLQRATNIQSNGAAPSQWIALDIINKIYLSSVQSWVEVVFSSSSLCGEINSFSRALH